MQNKNYIIFKLVDELTIVLEKLHTVDHNK